MIGVQGRDRRLILEARNSRAGIENGADDSRPVHQIFEDITHH
jgi:hypothetical protein